MSSQREKCIIEK